MTTSSLQEFGLFIVVFFPAWALVIVALRSYSRLSAGQFGVDDGFILVAMGLSIGQTYVTWGFIKTNYVGIHLVDIPEHNLVLGLKFNFAVQIFYNPILAIVKNSILVFLLRHSIQRNSMKYSIYGLLAFNTLLMVAIFITIIFQCLPISYNWDRSIKDGRCIEQATFYVVTAAISLFTDILVLGLPIWIVIGLNMACKMKLAVIGIFLLGFIVMVVGVMRLVILTRSFFYPPLPDYIYNIGFYISSVETNLAIITASIAAIKPLFRRWFPSLFSQDSGYTNSQYEGKAFPRYGNNSSRSADVAKIKNALKSGHNDLELNDTRGRAEIPSTATLADSEEDIIRWMDGIIKTTNASVKYTERAVDRESERSRRYDYEMRMSIETL